MPENITINKELGIIEVESHGKVTYEEGLSSLAILEASIRDSGIKKVLSDTRKQDFKPSTMNVYDFGTRLPRDVRIAIIVSEEQPTVQDASFLRDVAFNRGVNIRLFCSRRDALAWLMD